MFSIEVAYASPQKQKIIKLTLSQPITIHAAILQSGILDLFPEIDLEKSEVGIWSEIKSLSALVSPGDRIEIYRSLHIDPKQARVIRVRKLRKARF